jgi:hypothetical protein
MQIKKAIYKYLSTHTGLKALVDTRIYPSLRPPANGFPSDSIAYGRISDSVDYTHDGMSRLYSPNFTFNCFSSSEYNAEMIALKLREAMESFTGTWEGIIVSKAFYTGGSDLFVTEPENFQVSLSFNINHY